MRERPFRYILRNSLARWGSLFIFLVFCFLPGCMQSKEYLSIGDDGSGVLEADLKVPASTISLIDSTMGAMMKGMMQAFGSQEKPPESVAEKMFGDKEEIVKKAQKAGLNIEFLDFNSEKKDGDLYVHYKFKFDDISKLLSSGILSTKFALYKNNDGDIVCLLEKNPQKAQESKEKIRRFKEEGGQDNAVSQAMKQKMLEAMKDFKVEFIISLPTDIKSASGCFKKMDDKTAVLLFHGDILTDPSVVDELYGMTDVPNEVVWAAQGLNFKLETASVEKKAEAKTVVSPSKTDASVAVGSHVKIFLKNMDSVEGKFVEETQDYIKIDTVGIPLIYFKDDIQRVEK